MAAKRAGFSLLIYIVKQKPVACLAIAGRLRALESYPRVRLLGRLSHFPAVVSFLSCGSLCEYAEILRFALCYGIVTNASLTKVLPASPVGKPPPPYVIVRCTVATRFTWDPPLLPVFEIKYRD